jgi:TRAP-type C4-dicarboxylate transport system permease small subunit
MADTSVDHLGHRIESTIHTLSAVARGIATVLLSVMILLITVDVVGRYIFSHSIKGAVDVIEEILVFIVFFTMAEVAANREHIKVELITSLFSERTQKILYGFTSFGCLVITAIIAWQVGVRGWALIKRPTLTTLNLEWPLGPFYLVASLGMFLMCLELAVDFYKTLLEILNRKTKN